MHRHHKLGKKTQTTTKSMSTNITKVCLIGSFDHPLVTINPKVSVAVTGVGEAELETNRQFF